MMAEIPSIAPRNMAKLMSDIVTTHQKIREEIQQHAADEQARRDALDQRRTAEMGLGYKS